MLALLLPTLVLAADLGPRLLRTVPRWMALVAGQSAVHVVLSVAAGCAGAAAGASHGPVLAAAVPVSNLVMAPAHVAALLACVALAVWVDRAMQMARHLRLHVCRRMRAAVSLLLQGGGAVVGLPRLPAPIYRTRQHAVWPGGRRASRAPPARAILLGT